MVKYQTFTIDISSSTTVSDEQIVGGNVFAFEMPADWDAANLNIAERPLLAPGSEGQLWNVYDAGVQRVVTAAEDRFIRVDPQLWRGVYKLQLTATSAQSADRVIRVWFE